MTDTANTKDTAVNTDKKANWFERFEAWLERQHKKEKEELKDPENKVWLGALGGILTAFIIIATLTFFIAFFKTIVVGAFVIAIFLGFAFISLACVCQMRRDARNAAENIPASIDADPEAKSE